MSRSQKIGLDFFPLDIDFFADRKIRQLKARFGIEAILIVLELWAQIYRDGFYTPFDDDLIFLIAEDLTISENKVRQVFTYLTERGMLDEKLLAEYGVLSGTAIQERWQRAIGRRAEKTPITVPSELWLLQEAETRSFIKCTQKEVSSAKKEDNSPKNSDNSAKNDLNINKSIKGSKKEKEKEKESGGGGERVRVYEADIREIWGRAPDEHEASELSAYADRDADLFKLALHIAADADSKSLRYIRGIYRNFEKRGIKNVTDYMSYEEKRTAKKGKRGYAESEGSEKEEDAYLQNYEYLKRKREERERKKGNETD